jgi:hypothetical protein
MVSPERGALLSVALVLLDVTGGQQQTKSNCSILRIPPASVPRVRNSPEVVRCSESISNDNGIALTYEPIHSDGAGAQLHRIFGTYALSHSLGFGYIHSPIGPIHYGPILQLYNGLRGLENNLTTMHEDLLYSWRNLSDLRSFKTLGCSRFNNSGDGCAHILVPYPEYGDLRKFAADSCNSKLVVHIVFPQAVLDYFPHYNVDPTLSFQSTLPWLSEGGAWNVSASRLRVAVHVRRGDLYLHQASRMLPNSYYISICQLIKKVLDDLAIPHVYEVYTEQVTKELNLTGSILKGQLGITDPGKVDPSQNHLGDFDILEPREMYVNLDAVSTMKGLSTAHILVMSRSSFSQVAGMLHDYGSGIVIYYPYWHSASTDWFKVNTKLQDHQRMAQYDELKDKIITRFKVVCQEKS